MESQIHRRCRGWRPALCVAAALIAVIGAVAGVGLPPIAQALPAPLARAEAPLVSAEAAWPAADIHRLVLESAGGPVELIGTDAEEIRVHAEFAPTAPAIGAPRISMTSDDGTLRIAPDTTDGTGRCKSLTVEVPRGIALVVRSASGGVTGRNLAGTIDIQSLSGDIRMHDVAGQIAAEVSAGDITVVHAPNWTPGEALSCKSLDGAIHITLPAESEFDLAVRSLNAPFETEFPISVRGTLERRQFDSRVGNGGPRIELNTLDGDIALHQRD
jgi:DUF4097 and DUF4098 domain-containing protein YvlB